MIAASCAGLSMSGDPVLIIVLVIPGPSAVILPVLNHKITVRTDVILPVRHIDPAEIIRRLALGKSLWSKPVLLRVSRKRVLAFLFCFLKRNDAGRLPDLSGTCLQHDRRAAVRAEIRHRAGKRRNLASTVRAGEDLRFKESGGFFIIIRLSVLLQRAWIKGRFAVFTVHLLRFDIKANLRSTVRT